MIAPQLDHQEAQEYKKIMERRWLKYVEIRVPYVTLI